MGVRIVERAICGIAIPLQAYKLTVALDGEGMSTADQDAAKPPPRVVYGYIRVATGDQVRATILKEDLLAFCRRNGFMLSTVFADFGVDDAAIGRPGFASLLDVCQLVGSYGVVVPTRMHLSSYAPTLEILTLQIKRTGTKLVVVDEIVAAGPSEGSRDAHA